MKHLNKLNEAHAIVKNTKQQLNEIYKLKLSASVQSNFSDELGEVQEALELLRVKLQALAIQEEMRGKK